MIKCSLTQLTNSYFCGTAGSLRRTTGGPILRAIRSKVPQSCLEQSTLRHQTEWRLQHGHHHSAAQELYIWVPVSRLSSHWGISTLCVCDWLYGKYSLQGFICPSLQSASSTCVTHDRDRVWHADDMLWSWLQERAHKLQCQRVNTGYGIMGESFLTHTGSQYC